MAALFTPLTLGDITIKNRICMSAMTRNRADPNRVPSHIMKKYYLQRALGGAGIIVTEATLISPQQGSQFDRSPGIWNAEQVAGWRKITNVVHLAGGRIYCQVRPPDLYFSFADSCHLTVMACWSSEPWFCRWISNGSRLCAVSHPGSSNQRLLPLSSRHTRTRAEIPDPSVIVAQFKDAAHNAKIAGFDGVELHAASGFLVHQFLDSTSNVRTDKWGGSSENRARFGLEVLKACVEVFGTNVSLKISPEGGFNDMGMPLKDTVETFSYFISEADKLNLSYITLYRYTPHKDPPIKGKERGTPHDIISTYGKLIQKAKTFVVGGVTPEEADELVKTGQVDGVFFGVAWLTHPDLAKRIRHGKSIDNMLAVPHLYGDSNVDPKLGYTDYPAVTY